MLHGHGACHRARWLDDSLLLWHGMALLHDEGPMRPWELYFKYNARAGSYHNLVAPPLVIFVCSWSLLIYEWVGLADLLIPFGF